eukprot:10669644-Alexandrium_andersonii.AAC.1
MCTCGLPAGSCLKNDELRAARARAVDRPGAHLFTMCCQVGRAIARFVMETSCVLSRQACAVA